MFLFGFIGEDESGVSYYAEVVLLSKSKHYENFEVVAMDVKCKLGERDGAASGK